MLNKITKRSETFHYINICEQTNFQLYIRTDNKSDLIQVVKF